MPVKNGGQSRQSRQHKKGGTSGPKSGNERAELQSLFLTSFAEMGTITHAAKATGIDRQTHYNWLESDPEYAERFKEADEQATDNLEREARRRAVAGVEEPVFYQGDIVGHIRKMSDTLLIFLLKGAKPEKYRERFEHTARGGLSGPVTVYEIPSNGRDKEA